MTRQWSSFVANLDPNDSGGMFDFLFSPALRVCILPHDSSMICVNEMVADLDLIISL
jgi:hypothetical protein